MAKDGTVFLIDDDDAVRDSLGWLLRTRRLLSLPYPSAEAFWAEARNWVDGPTEPCCALLDLRMPGMSGLALFELLREQAWFSEMPVIFLSGHADVPTAVDAVLHGAFDFCEKPFSDKALVERIERALEKSSQSLAQRQRQREIQQLVGGLTEREQAVMQLIAAGLANKLVADQLQISVRTVEVHRARIFEKMGVKSVLELVRRLEQG
ncbi:MAG: hypothetical protein RLZZ555_772 [Pseudomonadota bacterium]|jgi:two-component system, LuxR family, response regulator DctR